MFVYMCFGLGSGVGYGVATISRMLKNIGLFCTRALQKRPVFCKETCIFKHPTRRSHPIWVLFGYLLGVVPGRGMSSLHMSWQVCGVFVCMGFGLGLGVGLGFYSVVSWVQAGG